MKIALILGCLALAAGRTITVQKTSLSLTEDSEEASELNGILRAVFSYTDVTSVEQDGDIVQDCRKGKCEFCKGMVGHTGCFVATSGKDSFVVELTLDKKSLLKTVVKGPNPPEVCRPSIPGFPTVKNVCLQVKDVNLKQASGCVYVSLKVSGRKSTKKLGCFKIPKSDGMDQKTGPELLQVEAQDTGAQTHDRTVLKFEGVNTPEA